MRTQSQDTSSSAQTRETPKSRHFIKADLPRTGFFDIALSTSGLFAFVDQLRILRACVGSDKQETYYKALQDEKATDPIGIVALPIAQGSQNENPAPTHPQVNNDECYIADLCSLPLHDISLMMAFAMYLREAEDQGVVNMGGIVFSFMSRLEKNGRASEVVPTSVVNFINKYITPIVKDEPSKEKAAGKLQAVCLRILTLCNGAKIAYQEAADKVKQNEQAGVKKTAEMLQELYIVKHLDKRIVLKNGFEYACSESKNEVMDAIVHFDAKKLMVLECALYHYASRLKIISKQQAPEKVDLNKQWEACVTIACKEIAIKRARDRGSLTAYLKSYGGGEAEFIKKVKDIVLEEKSSPYFGGEDAESSLQQLFPDVDNADKDAVLAFPVGGDKKAVEALQKAVAARIKQMLYVQLTVLLRAVAPKEQDTYLPSELLFDLCRVTDVGSVQNAYEVHLSSTIKKGFEQFGDVLKNALGLNKESVENFIKKVVNLSETTKAKVAAEEERLKGLFFAGRSDRFEELNEQFQKQLTQVNGERDEVQVQRDKLQEELAQELVKGKELSGQLAATEEKLSAKDKLCHQQAATIKQQSSKIQTLSRTNERLEEKHRTECAALQQQVQTADSQKDALARSLAVAKKELDEQVDGKCKLESQLAANVKEAAEIKAAMVKQTEITAVLKEQHQKDHDGLIQERDQVQMLLDQARSDNGELETQLAAAKEQLDELSAQRALEEKAKTGLQQRNKLLQEQLAVSQAQIVVLQSSQGVGAKQSYSAARKQLVLGSVGTLFVAGSGTVAVIGFAKIGLMGLSTALLAGTVAGLAVIGLGLLLYAGYCLWKAKGAATADVVPDEPPSPTASVSRGV